MNTLKLSQMEAYDQLPRSLRDVVKESVIQWDTVMMLVYLNKAMAMGATLAQATKRLEQKLHQWNAEEKSKCLTTSTTS